MRPNQPLRSCKSKPNPEMALTLFNSKRGEKKRFEEKFEASGGWFTGFRKESISITWQCRDSSRCQQRSCSRLPRTSQGHWWRWPQTFNVDKTGRSRRRTLCKTVTAWEEKSMLASKTQRAGWSHARGWGSWQLEVEADAHLSSQISRALKNYAKSACAL